MKDMNTMETTSSGVNAPLLESAMKALRQRMDDLLGRLHALTRRRDAGELTLQESLPIELSLVVELGQVQDRLRLMGGHTYDGCRECHPLA
jgi:hypothetical protein